MPVPAPRRQSTLSLAEARRIAISAQGLAVPRPRAVTMRHLDATIQRMGVLQIDSVNVLTRSQFLPLFSRLGSYDRELLARAAGQRPRRVTEYWAHQAAFIPVALHPLFRWRMATYEREAWGSIQQAGEKHSDVVQEVLAAVGELGPSTARRLSAELGHAPNTSKGHWGWNWSVVKSACEFLFFTGELTVAERNTQFERVFDLPGRALPVGVVGAPTPSEDEAMRELVRVAARAHGVATDKCLADYWRTRLAPTRRAIQELLEEGALEPVTVEGTPAYLSAGTAIPRKVRARALLSPFDPLVWHRDRTQWLFGFRYRIGIYTPAAQRVHGYYVLPFLLDGALVGRVDLKADRAAGKLLVQSAFQEPGAPGDTAWELARELRAMAGWLGLADVIVMPRGDLAAALEQVYRAG